MPRESSKTCQWEKERRNRLNQGFTALSKVLPCYDPSVNISKITILQKAASCIQELQEKVKNLVSPSSAKEAQGDIIKKLQDRVKKLLLRNEQLTKLLKDAGLPLPRACGDIKGLKNPQPLSNKISKEQAKLFKKNYLEKENSETPQNLVARKLSKNRLRGSTFIAPKHRKAVVNRTENKKAKAIKKGALPNAAPNQKCVIVLSQPSVTQSCYIIKNTLTNNIAKIASNSTVITNSALLTTPLVSSNIKPFTTTVLAGSTSSLSTLGPGTLILANGTIVPVIPQPNVLPPPPTIIAANTFTSTNKSTVIVVSSVTVAQENVQTHKPVVASNVEPKKTVAVSLGTKSLPRLRPRICLTRTTQINKVPIPALTSRYANNYLILSNNKNESDKNKPKTKEKKNCNLENKGGEKSKEGKETQKRKAETDIVDVASKKVATDSPADAENKKKKTEQQVVRNDVSVSSTTCIAEPTLDADSTNVKCLSNENANLAKNTNTVDPARVEALPHQSMSQALTKKEITLHIVDPISNNVPCTVSNSLSATSCEDSPQTSAVQSSIFLSQNVKDIERTLDKVNKNILQGNSITITNDSVITESGVVNDKDLVEINSLPHDTTKTYCVREMNNGSQSNSQLNAKSIGNNTNSQVTNENNGQDKKSSHGTEGKPSIPCDIFTEKITPVSVKKPVEIEVKQPVSCQSYIETGNSAPSSLKNTIQTEVKQVTSCVSLNKKVDPIHFSSKNSDHTELKHTSYKLIENMDPVSVSVTIPTVKVTNITESSKKIAESRKDPKSQTVTEREKTLLGHSELSNDIFASLQVATAGCQNPESTSPTAAFLLAFPLVSSLNGVKVTEVIDEDNSQSQRGTPTLLQIGTMDTTKTTQSHTDSLTPSLLNLDNFSFFNAKDCNSFYNNTYEMNSTAITVSVSTSNTTSNVSNSRSSAGTTTTSSSVLSSNVKSQSNLHDNRPYQETDAILKGDNRSNAVISNNNTVCEKPKPIEKSSSHINASQNINYERRNSHLHIAVTNSINSSASSTINSTNNINITPTSSNSIKNSSNIKMVTTNAHETQVFNTLKYQTKMKHEQINVESMSQKQVFPLQNKHFLNRACANFSNEGLRTVTTCSYVDVTRNYNTNPLYTNSNNNVCNYYNSDNTFNQTYCKNTNKTDNRTFYHISHENFPDYRRNYSNNLNSNYYGSSNQSYNKDKFNTNVAPKGKPPYISNKPPINWMTTPDNRVQTSTEYFLAPLNKEEFGHNPIYASSSFASNPQTTYFNTTAMYTTSDLNNSTADTRKNVDLPLVPVNSYQRTEIEENQFSWSPTKLPQFLEPPHTFVSSTLPTLVGDLALGNSLPFNDQKSDTKCSKDNRIKESKRAKSSNYEAQPPNFLSVSQLVDHNRTENIPARATTRRNSGNRNKNNSPQKPKRINSKPENKDSVQNFNNKTDNNLKNNQMKVGPNFSVHGNNNDAYCEQKTNRNLPKSTSTNYSAEALIGHQMQADTMPKRQNYPVTSKSISVPPFLPDNIIPYFPPVDLPQENNYIQQNQSYQPTSFSHNFTNTFGNNSYTSNTFIPPVSTITTTYLPSNNFMHDMSAHDYMNDNLNLFPNTNKDNKNCNKNLHRQSNSREEKSNQSNVNSTNHFKKSKKKHPSDSNLPGFEFPFLSMPGSINSPILPDDFHTHTSFLPPPTPYPCKNPLYTKQNAELGSNSLLPLVHGSRSSIQHPEISPSLNNPGNTLTNFNLSTIFPEINKGPLPEIFPESRAKDQGSTRNYNPTTSAQVPFNNKPTFSFSSYNSQ